MLPRRMKWEDLASVVSIERDANLFPWTLRNFEDCLDAGYHAWVFSAQQAIIGYTIAQPVLNEVHLLNLCVEPGFQRQGYGRLILHHVIDFAREVDATLIVLEVRRSNERAQQLYLQAGFNEMSVRRGYYPAEQGREDAILMGLDLAIPPFFEDK